MPPPNANTALSLQLQMKFGNIVGVETSRHCRSKVLAAKHTASLQLLCTVSSNQARLDARAEFKILEPSPKGGWKLVVHITVLVIVGNSS
jgi:hypothetical protein